MVFNWDPVYLVNLALCVIISLLGYWGYRKLHDSIPLLIGLAFGLFGISDILTIFDLTTELANIPLVIRVLAYLPVILALYKGLTRTRQEAR